MQVTKFELERQREAANEAAAANKAERDRQARREVDSATYERMVDVNVAESNDVSAIDAHNVDEALAQLTTAECVFTWQAPSHHCTWYCLCGLKCQARHREVSAMWQIVCCSLHGVTWLVQSTTVKYIHVGLH